MTFSKSGVAVVGLDHVGAVLRADPRGKAQVAGVADQFLAHGRHAQHRHRCSGCRIDHRRQVADREGLELAADGHHHGHHRGVQPQAFLDVQDALVVQLREHGRAGRGAERDRLVAGRRHDLPQGPAGTHQAVGVGDQRHDRKVHPLQARGRAHDVAVVEGQHHGLAARGVEDPGQAVLHAPVEMGQALEEEAFGLLGNADAIVFGVEVVWLLRAWMVLRVGSSWR